MYRFLSKAYHSLRKNSKKGKLQKRRFKYRKIGHLWCHGGDLNSRPPAYETSALTSWATVTLKFAIIFNVCLYIDKILSFLRSRAPKSQILKFKFEIFVHKFLKFKSTKIQIWDKNAKNKNLHFQGAGFAAQIR